MIKRLVYIFLLLIFTSRLSSAKPCSHSPLFIKNINLYVNSTPVVFDAVDTSKVKNSKNTDDDKKKIKEIAKARKQAKPEKLGQVPSPADTLKNKVKLKRQRRPEGLERPPEIPRRNNN